MPAMKRRAALIAALLPPGWVTIAQAAGPSDDDGLETRLRAGRVALLLRHSITDPGVGDPPGFRLDACSTQRNLSAEGRAQAQRIGAWFGARGLLPARVRSSAWCRCIDTGTLAFGRVEPWEALNSTFGNAAAQARQSAALDAALRGIGAGAFEVWVTHQVNISALIGAPVSMGEGCVVERADGAPRVVARFSAGA